MRVSALLEESFVIKDRVLLSKVRRSVGQLNRRFSLRLDPTRYPNFLLSRLLFDSLDAIG